MCDGAFPIAHQAVHITQLFQQGQMEPAHLGHLVQIYRPVQVLYGIIIGVHGDGLLCGQPVVLSGLLNLVSQGIMMRQQAVKPFQPVGVDGFHDLPHPAVKLRAAA